MTTIVAQAGNCCGAQVLYGFSGSVDDIRRELKSHKTSRMYAQAGMTTLYINDGQHLRYHDVLEEEGFKCVVSGAHNSKHDSKIYLYCHVFRPEKSDPVLYPAAEVDY